MATVIKLKRSTTANGTPTTSDLVDGEVAINITDKKVFMRSGSSIVAIANFNDLSSVAEDIIPDANNTRNLGSASKRWSELFLSGSTINLGGSTISSDGTGAIAISATGATLPVGSKIEVAAGGDTTSIATATSEGTTIRTVPFFSAAGGLGTANALLTFKSGKSTVANFVLANGNTLTSTNELFLF